MPNRAIGLVLAAAFAATTFAAGAAEKKAVFELHSPAYKEFTMLSMKNVGNNPPNCSGGDTSPPLAWSGAPAGTKSFAMELFDLVGNPPLGVVHWIAYGIPGSKTSLKEGDGGASSAALVNGKGTAGKQAYAGPCPPPGKPHPYTFLLMATDLAPDALTPGMTREDLATALKGHILDRTSLVLRYGH